MSPRQLNPQPASSEESGMSAFQPAVGMETNQRQRDAVGVGRGCSTCRRLALQRNCSQRIRTLHRSREAGRMVFPASNRAYIQKAVVDKDSCVGQEWPNKSQYPLHVVQFATRALRSSGSGIVAQSAGSKLKPFPPPSSGGFGGVPATPQARGRVRS